MIAATNGVGIERVRSRDSRITVEARRGSCLMRARASAECEGGEGTRVGCCSCTVLAATLQTTRLLESWETAPSSCDCLWCRREALTAAQRRAREPRILAVSHESPPTPLPPWIMAAFERPSLREMAHAAQRVIPRLMGPAWWLRPSAPRRLPTDGSTP